MHDGTVQCHVGKVYGHKKSFGTMHGCAQTFDIVCNGNIVREVTCDKSS
jgi:hypothetical protein